MALTFRSPQQEKLYRATLLEVGALGFQGELLQEGYAFRDWFAQNDASRVAPAAAFGRTPVSYDNACAVVLLPKEHSGPRLVRDFRALGAPLAFEVHEDRVLEWRVSLEPRLDDLRSVIEANELSRIFAEKRGVWSPEAILREKNIGPPVPIQLDFCDRGLIPALEENIRAKLDPLLRNVLARARDDYLRRKTAQPDSRSLFRLAVWSLSGKVFHDRGIAPFSHFNDSSDPDDVLLAVAKYYGVRWQISPIRMDGASKKPMSSPPRLLMRPSRERRSSSATHPMAISMRQIAPNTILEPTINPPS